MENITQGYIRSDGWVYSEEGLKRLRQGGRKGSEAFMRSMKSQVGEWREIRLSLRKEAVDAYVSVKGFVSRVVFVSAAIVKEAERRATAKGEGAETEWQAVPLVSKRLYVTMDAARIVDSLAPSERSDFISEAIVRR